MVIYADRVSKMPKARLAVPNTIRIEPDRRWWSLKRHWGHVRRSICKILKGRGMKQGGDSHKVAVVGAIHDRQSGKIRWLDSLFE